MLKADHGLFFCTKTASQVFFSEFLYFFHSLQIDRKSFSYFFTKHNSYKQKVKIIAVFNAITKKLRSLQSSKSFFFLLLRAKYH